MVQRSPTERLYAIVEEGLCVGCGLCQAVAPPRVIDVRKVSTGYEVPVVVGGLDHATVDTIYDICPGTRVDDEADERAGPGACAASTARPRPSNAAAS